MSPRRRVLLSALTPAFILLAALAAPAYAQIYDAARGSIGFSLDAIERSPRLLGMGQLTYVGDDSHNRITLWDFAANPLGILSADTAEHDRVLPGDLVLLGRPQVGQRDERPAAPGAGGPRGPGRRRGLAARG